jgi:hypothetical protein
MESKGAEVVSVELAPDMGIAPEASDGMDVFVSVCRARIERIRYGYWFIHERLGSMAKVPIMGLFALPDEPGHFDTAVMCSVLLHVRDPLHVVESCARLSTTLVVTDMRWGDLPDDQPVMAWFSQPGSPSPDIWWRFSPQLFVRFAEVMDMESTVSFLQALFTADDNPRQGDSSRLHPAERLTVTPVRRRGRPR